MNEAGQIAVESVKNALRMASQLGYVIKINDPSDGTSIDVTAQLDSLIAVGVDGRHTLPPQAATPTAPPPAAAPAQKAAPQAKAGPKGAKPTQFIIGLRSMETLIKRGRTIAGAGNGSAWTATVEVRGGPADPNHPPADFLFQITMEEFKELQSCRPVACGDITLLPNFGDANG